MAKNNKTVVGLHKAISNANNDFLNEVLSISMVIKWWLNELNTSVNRKDVLNLTARFFNLKLLTPVFIIENCGQSKTIDGKQVICRYTMVKNADGTRSRILSDDPLLRFSPAIAGNAIKNYYYKQAAIVASQQPAKDKSGIHAETTAKSLNKTSTLKDQAIEVKKTENKVNYNKRQNNANKAAKTSKAA